MDAVARPFAAVLAVAAVVPEKNPIVVPKALKVNINSIAGLRFSLLPFQPTNSFRVKLVSLGRYV